jgi:hypothetical protein
MELAPCLANRGTGCQGFAGPLPSAFLDKQIKNCCKDKTGRLNSKIIFMTGVKQASPFIVTIFGDSTINYD